MKRIYHFFSLTSRYVWLCFFCILGNLHSQTETSTRNLSNLEQELLLQKGIGAFNEGQFDRALAIFMEVQQATLLPNPKGEYWLGRTFEVEGQYTIAETQFQEALEGSRIWSQKELEIEILYHFAEFYYAQRKFVDFEASLENIIYLEEEPNAQSMALEKSLIENVSSIGLYDTLYISRKELSFSIRAYSFLALYHKELLQEFELNSNIEMENIQIGTDHRRSFLRNATLASVAKLSALLNILRELNPEFSLSQNFNDLWEKAPDFLLERLEQEAKELKLALPYSPDYSRLDLNLDSEKMKTNLEYLQKENPFLGVENLDYVFYLIKQNEVLVEWVKTHELMQDLFFLANALYVNGAFEQARKIWRFIIRQDSGYWRSQALVRLS